MRRDPHRSSHQAATRPSTPSRSAPQNCLVTYTASTAGAAYHDEGALAVAPALAGPGYTVSVDDLFVKDAAGATMPNPQLQSLIDARLAAGVAAA